MKKAAFLILTLVTFCFCQAQKQNSLYYGVSSDSLHTGHQLVFTSDSTLQISTFPRHMSQQFKMTLNYKRNGGTIKVLNRSFSKLDSIALTNHGFQQFLNVVTFTIENKAVVDTSSSIVYVQYKDFRKKYYLTYLIDGKIYKQETGISDAYGLIKNKTKDNKALKRKLESIKDDLNNYSVAVHKGLDAYKQFGYDCVFGVIELKRRN